MSCPHKFTDSKWCPKCRSEERAAQSSAEEEAEAQRAKAVAAAELADNKPNPGAMRGAHPLVEVLDEVDVTSFGDNEVKTIPGPASLKGSASTTIWNEAVTKLENMMVRPLPRTMRSTTMSGAGSENDAKQWTRDVLRAAAGLRGKQLLSNLEGSGVTVAHVMPSKYDSRCPACRARIHKRGIVGMVTPLVVDPVQFPDIAAQAGSAKSVWLCGSCLFVAVAHDVRRMAEHPKCNRSLKLTGDWPFPVVILLSELNNVVGDTDDLEVSIKRSSNGGVAHVITRKVVAE